MEQNKSIDGLVSRRSKKAGSSPATTKTTTKTTAKTITKTTTKTTAKSTTKPTRKPTSKTTKPTKSSKPKNPTPKPTPNIPLADVNDFLAPTQTFNFDEASGELQAATLSPAPKNQLSTPDTTLDTSKKNLKKAKKEKKAKKKMSKKRKIVISILSFILILLIAGGIWLHFHIASITNNQSGLFDLLTFLDDTYEPLKTDENGRTNILAFGTSGYDMEGSEGNGTHDGAQLTDSIMIISLDQETGDLAMLSLPRDLKVSKTCTATGKVNEIYWCNNMEGDNEQAGAEALMEEVSDILGIDFQYYAHLNWGALVQIVNILGGINVTLDEPIHDYSYTKAVFEPGIEYTLDGEQALGLARARHGTESGDFSRGASQQKILIGIKDKLFEKNLSITDLTDLIGTIGDNLRTSFNVEELKTLAHLTSDFDFNNIRQLSLIDPEPLMTTGTINGISYVLPAGGANYYTKIQNYVAKMLSSDPRDREDASILVLNGTDTPGLASTEQATLEEAGYDNIDINDAPAGEYASQYTLYSLTDTAPETKKLLEEQYNTTALTIDDLPAGINQYYDFVIIIGDIASPTIEPTE